MQSFVLTGGYRVARLLMISSFVLVGSHALAVNLETTYAIPQVSKIQRQMHGLAATATRTDRKVAGGDYTLNKGEEKTAGVKTAEPESTVIRPYAFYNFNNGFAAEGQISISKIEEDATSGALKSDDSEIKLAAGYAIPDTHWAIGLGIGKEKKDEPTGGVDEDSDIIAISANLKLTEEMYFGFGVERTNSDFETGLGPAKIDNIDQYTVAIGWINGGAEKPTSAFETGLLWFNESGRKLYALVNQYTLNLSEQSQLHVDLIAGYVSKSGSDSRVLGTSGRYDYQIAPMWYVAPQVAISKSIQSGDDESTDVGFGVEGGIRHEKFAAFVSLDQNNTKLDSATVTSKNEEAILALGGHYYF